MQRTKTSSQGQRGLFNPEEMIDPEGPRGGEVRGLQTRWRLRDFQVNVSTIKLSRQLPASMGGHVYIYNIRPPCKILPLGQKLHANMFLLCVCVWASVRHPLGSFHYVKT